MSETNKQRKRDQKRSYHNMFGVGWHQSDTGKNEKKAQSPATTGATKNIKASPIQKGFCRRNRSYKDPRYAQVMASLGRRTLAS